MQVIVVYVVPLAVGTGVSNSSDTGSWELGYYGHVGQLVGGMPLAWGILLSAAVSQIGMFEAEMSSDSYQASTHACTSACHGPACNHCRLQQKY